MKIAKIIHSIAEIFEECPTKYTEEDLYRKQQQLIFYQVVLEKQFSLRFTINTTLISISTACLAFLLTIMERLFARGIPPTFKQLFIGGLICFVFLIILCVIMYELDSKQLQRLKKANDGESCNIDALTNITEKLLKLQYLLLIVGVVLTCIIFCKGVLYA